MLMITLFKFITVYNEFYYYIIYLINTRVKLRCLKIYLKNYTSKAEIRVC